MRFMIKSLSMALALWCGLGIMPSTPEARTVTIGIVRDGDPARDDIAPLIEAELQQLVAGDIQIRFKYDPAFNAGWDALRAREVLASALGDPQVDYVLTMGVLTSQEAARPEWSLSKPVISAFAQFADLYGTPYDPEGGSLKPNFNFAIVPGGATRDVREFLELESFEMLYIAVGADASEHLEQLPGTMDQWANDLGITSRIWPVSSDLQQSLEGIGDDVGAVLLLELPQLSKGRRTELITMLTDRRIMVFSLLGAPDVELGALAAFTGDLTQPLVRRVAINLNQLIRGEPVSSLPVTLAGESRLTINGRTASALGFAPSARIRAFARVIHPEALVPEGSPLSLEGALMLVQQTNLDLAIQSAEAERARSEADVARSPLLPQIGLSADYLSNGPESRQLWPWTQRFWGGVSASQMLYDDASISDYRSSKRAYEGQQANRESVRLTAMSRAGRAYLRWVLATVLYRVDLANLRLTEENRDLAQTRYEVGYSGRDEVYRWNAQVAQGRRSVLATEQIVETQLIRLNQILAVDQERRWTPQEVDVDPFVFPFLGGAVDSLYTRPALWQHFRNFLFAYALMHSPDIQSADLFLEAQGIQLGQRKRRWFLPEFRADFRYNYDFWRGTDPAGIDRYSYFIGVSAQYPLFTGLERPARVGKLKAEVQSLEYQAQLTSDRVERRARTSLERVQASFPAVRLTQVAAENTRKNFEIVQEKYTQGAVNITDMLEAQTADFNSQQSAVASKYQFLIDMIEMQAAIAWFELDQTPEAQREFLQQAELYVADPPQPGNTDE